MISLFLVLTTNCGDICQDHWHLGLIGGYFMGIGMINHDQYYFHPHHFNRHFNHEEQTLKLRGINLKEDNFSTRWGTTIGNWERDDRPSSIEGNPNPSVICAYTQVLSASVSKFNSLKLNFLRGSDGFKQKCSNILPKFKRKILTEN
jgi:hypothetical protein